jgi:hypothetical protein
VADGASTPSGRSPPRPAQAGRAAAAMSRAGDRRIAWLCSWIVLVAEVDERRLVRPLMAVGSSHPASCSDGERASEAGSRRQSREHGGGLSMIPYPRSARIQGRGSGHSSREGVLVSTKRLSLTRRSWRRAWRLRRAGPAERLDPVRAGAVTEDVRGYAMGSVRGRELRCRVASRGGAFDRGFARTAQRVVPLFTSVRGQHPEREARTPWSRRSWRFAVKRSSTRGSAVGHRPKVGRQRSEPRPRGGGLDLRSGIGQSAGCS